MDTAQFDAAAALAFVSSLLLGGNYNSNKQVNDVFTEIFKYRNVTLTETEAGIGIEVETLKPSPAANYDIGVTKDNILETTLTNIEEIDTDRVIKTVQGQYRFDNFKGDFIHKRDRQANPAGEDKPFPMNYIYRHSDGDEVLDFVRKMYIALATEWSFTGFKEAALRKADRIAVHIDIEGMQVDSDWRIGDITESVDEYKFKVNPYPATAFTYEPSPSLPPDELIIEPFFDETPPDPLANVVLSYTHDFDEAGNLQAFAIFTFDPPESNFDEARVIIRKNGDTVWSTGGSGSQNVRVPVTPGIRYDYQIAPYNSNGLSGLSQTFTNQLTPGDNTSPKTPVNLIGKGGLENMSWEWDPVLENQDNSFLRDLKGYQYRIYPSQSTAIQVYPKIGTGFYAFTTDTQVNINDLEGDLRSIKRTLWLEVRAIDDSGNASPLTVRVPAGTREILQDDILENEITDVASGANAGPITGQNNDLASAAINVRGYAVEVWAECNVKNDGPATSSGNSILVRRGTTTIRTRTEVHRGGTDL